MILERMPDVASLRNLVMASPDFYRCYKLAASKEAIFTAATLRQLRPRGLVLSVPGPTDPMNQSPARRAVRAPAQAAITPILAELVRGTTPELENMVSGEPVVLSCGQNMRLVEEADRRCHPGRDPQDKFLMHWNLRLEGEFGTLHVQLFSDPRLVDKALVSRRHDRWFW